MYPEKKWPDPNKSEVCAKLCWLGEPVFELGYAEYCFTQILASLWKGRLHPHESLEDIGQGQGSSHATHPLMPLIICTKYGKNPSRTVDATEHTCFQGQGQMTLKI